jgi:hypothetical protein
MYVTIGEKADHSGEEFWPPVEWIELVIIGQKTPCIMHTCAITS